MACAIVIGISVPRAAARRRFDLERTISMPAPARLLRVFSIIGGGLLMIIGLRFYLIPEHAARVFGLGPNATGFELHHVIAARDLWLGALAVAFAALKQWRALSLWFAMGLLVCLADAGVVFSSGGKLGPLLFHLTGAVLCAVLSVLAHRIDAGEGGAARP